MKAYHFSYVDLILILVGLIWGVNVPVMKVGVNYVPPLSYTFARLVLAAIVAWIVFLMSKTYKPMTKKDLILLAAISVLGYFGFQLCYALGVSRTTAGNAGLILGMLPVSVIIINRLFHLESVTAHMLAGIILTFFGVVLIVLGKGQGISYSHKYVVGGLLMLLGEFCYAYFTVFSKLLVCKYSNYQIMTYVLTICVAAIFFMSLPEMASINWLDIPRTGWVNIAFSGIFSMTVGNFMWVWGVKQIGSTRTSLYNNLTPVFAVLIGCLFLGESFGRVKFLGAAVIFLGLYLSKGREKKKQSEVV